MLSTMARRDHTPLYVSIVLAILVGGLVTLIADGHLASDVAQLLALAAGAAFVTALSAVSRYLNQGWRTPSIQITFNLSELSDELRKLQDPNLKSRHIDTWEPTSDKLLVQDPSLALAKVRIDLEREIQRIAKQTGVVRQKQLLDFRRTLDLLEKEHLLPQPVFAAIKDILPICNAAVHGQDVSMQTALRVVEIAAEVMQLLQSNIREPELSPSE